MEPYQMPLTGQDGLRPLLGHWLVCLKYRDTPQVAAFLWIFLAGSHAGVGEEKTRNEGNSD